KHNTAIAALMSMLNAFYDKGVNRAEYKTLLKLLNPFAPHITEELWQMLGETSLLSLETWPDYDPDKTVDASIEIGVQINGKLRSTVKLPMDCEQQVAIDTALADPKIAAAVEGKNIVKTIVVKNKIINIVAK
ncbi:MAG: class I tRNA ligase family protein, partial [Butyricicoccus sp.]